MSVAIRRATADDADFAGTVTYALSKRVRVDFNNQNFTDAEKSNGRINIGAIAALNPTSSPPASTAVSDASDVQPTNRSNAT